MTRRSPKTPQGDLQHPDRDVPQPAALTPSELDRVTGGEGSGAPVRNPPQGTFNFTITAGG